AEMLRFSVADTGVGLNAGDLARLFIPFERLGAAKTGVEGVGMGLVLARQLAEAMGGSMGVESTIGVGSTFWFELPIAQAPAADWRTPLR
ncbi:MAG: hybrid sensor histidine kinase/response regulator, partial [Chloroflexi bacterium]|nr:hybrid sensor histidine kinase/response regulator [Chloroflexota bacterium]